MYIRLKILYIRIRTPHKIKEPQDKVGQWRNEWKYFNYYRYKLFTDV